MTELIIKGVEDLRFVSNENCSVCTMIEQKGCSFYQTANNNSAPSMKQAGALTVYNLYSNE